MSYAVIFSRSAEADLLAIYDYIAERAGATTALRFVEAIESYCLGLEHTPERGTTARGLAPRIANCRIDGVR
jgi:toxin ParE1/3/4